MRTQVGADRTLKLAESDEDRLALRREARALRLCAHPGVVALLATEGGDPPQALVLPALAGGSMAAKTCAPLPTVIAWGAAIASTLADLHDIGWVHGSVSADHVLFDEQHRPVLCSFGRADAPADQPGAAAGAAADVAALARLLLERLPVDTDRRLMRYLSASAAERPGSSKVRGRLAVVGGRSVRGARNPARSMAGRLMELVPEASLGLDTEQDGRSELRPASGGRRKRLVVGVAAVGSCAAAVAVVVSVVTVGRRPPSHTPGALTMATTDRFVLTGPPGAHLLTVIGRWDCGPPRPAVEDLQTGDIWVFDRWPPPGSADSARMVGHVRQPVGLAVRRSSTGCEQLVALEGSGRLQVVAAPVGS